MTLYKQIETIATQQNMVSILNQLDEIKTADSESDFLDLLILGRFKAGKSSFINHLLNINILPTGVLPVTAIVTRISYGRQAHARVTHLDHRVEDIELSRLSEFISESENPENTKEVLVVDLFLPEMKPFEPLRLVDTPGLGSIFKHNTQVTLSWLGKIKAAIVVISAAQPLSEDDMALIKEAVEQSPKVYILLSKTDLVNGEDIKQINSFIKEKLQQFHSVDFETFPYSISSTGQELKQSVIRKMFNPLAQEAHSVHREVYEHKLRFLAKKTVGYLEINIKMQQQQEDERKKLELQIVDETLNFKYIKQELFQIGNSYKKATRDFLKDLFLHKHAPVLKQELSADLNLQFDSWQGNLAKVTKQYEQWIRETMVVTIKQIELQEWSNIAGHAGEAFNHFNSYLKNFRERLNHNIKTILNIEMPAGEIEIKASPLQSPPIHISRTFDSHIDMLWFLIPMPLFRNSFKKHFINEIQHEIEKNSYRLIAQLTGNINHIIDEMQQRAVEYVQHELDSLNLALRQHQGDENKLKQMKEILTKQILT